MNSVCVASYNNAGMTDLTPTPADYDGIHAGYMAWSVGQIRQTLSGKFTTTPISPTPSAKSSAPAILPTASGLFPDLSALAQAFPLPWSAYVRLLSVRNPQARAFYETEALRCGWSVRQLDRQIDDPKEDALPDRSPTPCMATGGFLYMSATTCIEKSSFLYTSRRQG